MSRMRIQGAIDMGEVMLVYKVMPNDPELDLDELEKKVTETAEKFGTLKGTKEEKVAFGLKAIIPTIVVDEESGAVNDLEDALREIDGVQSAETVDLTRL